MAQQTVSDGWLYYTEKNSAIHSNLASESTMIDSLDNFYIYVLGIYRYGTIFISLNRHKNDSIEVIGVCLLQVLS